MGRFEQIAKKVAALPMDRQDVIAGVIEDAFDGDLNPRSLLSDAQLQDLRVRIAESSDDDIATDEEVEAAFEGLMSRTRRAG
jgi:Asp-tRNA(Asn)/Glu-tRNA(Gln) amidotransferase A subunit family amidase